jgi:hypothetical protein
MVSRGTRLSVTDLPDDWTEYCIQRRPDLKPHEVFEDFCDYWIGRGETMVDWKRTWQTWVRNARSKPVTQDQKLRPRSSWKPLPPRNPDSPEYREFCEWSRKFRERVACEHPDAVDNFVRAGAISEADREWIEERLAIQEEGNALREP